MQIICQYFWFEFLELGCPVAHQNLEQNGKWVGSWSEFCSVRENQNEHKTMKRLKDRKLFTLPLAFLLSACGGARLQDALSCAGSANCGKSTDDTITGSALADKIIDEPGIIEVVVGVK